MLNRGTTFGLILALSLFGAGAVQAGDSEPLPLISPPKQSVAPKVASDAALAELSGGANSTIAMTDQDLTAINSGNQISAGTVGSGAITLQGNALNGFAGVGNFIMNTGHNNNLQSSLSVTIIVTQ